MISTAILVRIIHRCEVFHLCVDSYRLKHRESIFGNYCVQNYLAKSANNAWRLQGTI
ncbi:MAG: hypothetical protein ACOX6S_14590 [Clostridia bacterium]